MTIQEIIALITPTTTKIKVGINVYGLLKRELGSFANKIKGVDFELDTSLEADSIELK